MTRLFTEGFESGDVLFFDTVSGSPTAGVTNVRSGSYSCAMNGDTEYGLKVISASAEIFLRLGWFCTDAQPTADQKIFAWYTGATELGSIRLTAQGQLKVYTGTGTLVATSTLHVLASIYYLPEVRIKLDDASGVIDVRLDGISFVSFSGDTKPGADTTLDRIRYYGTNYGTFYYDDLACNDTAGGVDDSWCGDGKVVALLPNAAGDVTALTPSAGSNYQCVDERPSNGDTDYVSSNAANYDLYNLAATALTSAETIKRVWGEVRAREDTAAADSIAVGLKTASTEYWGGSQAVTTTYKQYLGEVHKVNPNSTAAWTTTELDALQVGAKVV